MSASERFPESLEFKGSRNESLAAGNVADSVAPAARDASVAALGLDEPIREELVEEPLSATGPPRLPRPGLGGALLWAGLPIVAQVAVIAWIVLATTHLLAGARYGPAEIEEFITNLNPYFMPIGTLTTVGVALAVVGIAYRGQVASRLAWRNCTPVQWLGTLLLVAPLAILASEVGNCVAEVLPWIEPHWLSDFRKSNGEIFADFVAQPWLLVFLGGCLFPGIGEEIYCRGFLSRGLIARYGVLWGTLFTSMLFGAMHVEPQQSCQAFVLGLGLQFVFLTTRSLWAPIAVHTLNNFAAFLLMRYEGLLPIPGLAPPADDTVVHTPLPLLGAATLAFLAIAGVLLWTRTRWALAEGTFWSPGYAGAEAPPAEVGARPVTVRLPFGLFALTAAAYALLATALAVA